MGRKSDLKAIEKATITRELGSGKTTLQIATMLSRDHRTVKAYIENAVKTRKRSDFGKIRCVSKKQLTSLKRAVASNPMRTSKDIFSEVGVPTPCKTSRCKILKTMANVRKPKKQPPLTKIHKEKRLQWARKYLKLNFKTVMFSDECRATLDGPDGFCRGWLRHGQQTTVRLRRQQGGGGVLFWAAIYKSHLVGPFRVNDGVKMDSTYYCQLLKDKLLPFLRSLSTSERRQVVFMQDNAPSHASNLTKRFLDENNLSGSSLMVWPPSSPDLNPIENYWSVFKQKLYIGGKQYRNNDELWAAICETFAKMDRSLIEKLINSMDKRLEEVLTKQGNYIRH